ELVVQLLQVCWARLVQNHEITRDPFQSPVVMNLQKLADTRQAVCGLECRKQNWPVARYTHAPEVGLSELVVASFCSQPLETRMRIEKMARELLVQRSVCRSDAKLAKLGLCLRPRQVECAACAVGIVIQIGDLYRMLAIVGHERRERDFGRAARWNRDSSPQG